MPTGCGLPAGHRDRSWSRLSALIGSPLSIPAFLSHHHGAGGHIAPWPAKMIYWTSLGLAACLENLGHVFGGEGDAIHVGLARRSTRTTAWPW